MSLDSYKPHSSLGLQPNELSVGIVVDVDLVNLIVGWIKFKWSINFSSLVSLSFQMKKMSSVYR